MNGRALSSVIDRRACQPLNDDIPLGAQILIGVPGIMSAIGNARGPMKSDLVDIPGEIRGETDKAYRFFDGSQTIWLPKSQCEWDDHDKTMAMPEWLAFDKGLI